MGNSFYFDWEVDLIEWLQQTLGAAGGTVSKLFSFLGGETVSLLLLIILLFCYKKYCISCHVIYNNSYSILFLARKPGI